MKRLLQVLATAFDSKDLPVLTFFFALIMLGYGAGQFHDGLGFVVVGLILVLYVCPLKSWWTQ